MPTRMYYRSLCRITREAFHLPPLSDDSRNGEFDSISGATALPNKNSRRISIPHHYYAPHQYTNGSFRKLSEQSNLKRNIEPISK